MSILKVNLLWSVFAPLRVGAVTISNGGPAQPAIRRGEDQLFQLEAKLGLAARWQRICGGLREIQKALRAEDITRAAALADEMLREEEAEDGV